MNRFTALCFILGAALVVAGAGMIYRPLAPIAAGASFLSLGAMSTFKGKKT